MFVRSTCVTGSNSGPDADAAIAAKADLNRDHPDTVFAAMPDTEAEAQEVADVLVEHLRSRWPEREVELDAHLHPLDAAARLVPEDLALLVERDGQLVFGAGSICFPNRWDLRSKIGLPLAAVHAPVAQLNEQLEAPIDKFFDRLTPERSFWRLGWGVLDTADWYTPLDGTAAPRPSAPGPADHYLRVERETLRRFPETNAVLFTIRTYVTPIPRHRPRPRRGRAARRCPGIASHRRPGVQGCGDDGRGDRGPAPHRRGRRRANLIHLTLSICDARRGTNGWRSTRTWRSTRRSGR